MIVPCFDCDFMGITIPLRSKSFYGSLSEFANFNQVDSASRIFRKN